MDLQYVSETPAKRRKVGDEPSPKAFNSENDSGDEIFSADETVATVPLPKRPLNYVSHASVSPQTQRLTQPTQILSRPSNDHNSTSAGGSSTVQVTASSPVQPKPVTPKAPPALAISIAPAGTSFRPPSLVYRPPVSGGQDRNIIEISDGDDDDSPRYRGDSSDDELQLNKANIKPLSFGTSSKRESGQTDRNQFLRIISNSKFEPDPTNHVRDIPLEAIGDIQVRQKIRRMLEILPGKTVIECKDALFQKRNDFQDAMDFLSQQDFNDKLSQTAPSKPSAKQQLKDPVKKIHEKWAYTKTRPKPAEQHQSVHSPSKTTALPEVKPRRRRLVQKVPKPPRSPERVATPVDSSDSDSGIVTIASDDQTGERRALEFLRTCHLADLIDIASVSEDTANYIIAQRPFSSLDSVRRITKEASNKRNKKQRSQQIGERIVDRVVNMLAGYETVDKLIKICEDVARPLAEEIAKWGIAQATSKNGELEVVEIRPTDKDSGIGTPSSRGDSIERDSELELRKSGFNNMFSQPSNLAKGACLKEYQVFGFNWLYLLFRMGIQGGILADDMGLGKTCQVIAFLAHLYQQGVKGPHVIVVPSSTLENWLREFLVFCPDLNVVPYYASQQERANISEDILADRDSINVVLTTYTIAKSKDDNRFIRKLRPVCCIFDEGHMLRNSNAAGYEAYLRIPATFRLLLTGTPLQNNIAELCSLLKFILPSIFRDNEEELAIIFAHKAKTDDGTSHAALLSTERVQRAKSMMTPFVLRRKKYQVLKHLPAKTKRIVQCELSASQRSLYDVELKKAKEVWANKTGGQSTGKASIGIMMNFRKAAIHPCLFRQVYSDKVISKIAKACLRETEFCESNVDLVYEDLSVMSDMELHRFCERYKSVQSFVLKNQEWMQSGKVETLSTLLEQFNADGDRVLVFSQFVQVLDILEYVLETLSVSFFRLDGGTAVAERQSMIDEYNQNSHIRVFLLSTKAGGAGINLASANKVIIFDSSFNPQDDVQAENRAHRVGQTREVEVIRLVSRGTIEENILRLGDTKLALDDRIAGAADDNAAKQVEKEGMNMVEEMLRLETSKTAA